MNVGNTKASNQRASIPQWLRSRWGALGLGAGAYLLVFAVWAFFQGGGSEYAFLISNLAFFPISIFAVAAALRAALDRALEPRLRRAWSILTAAVALLLLGDLAFFGLDAFFYLPRESDIYYLVDAFYLAFYPLVLWGLLRLPYAPLRRSERLKFALDILIVMTSASMVVWYFIIVPTAAANPSDLASQVAAAVYPVGDLAALGGIVVLLLRRPDSATRSALILYLTGLLCFVGADLISAYTTLARKEVDGDPVSVGWMAAYVLFALAAVRQRRHEPAAAEEQWPERLRERLSPVLPFAATMLGYGLVIFVAGKELTLGSQGVLFSAVLLTGFVIGRQLVTLRENARLNAELRAFSADLEQRVVERTAQLRQSQDALSASQRLASVGALAAGIVHEVNSPLGSIVTASESLEVQLKDGDLDRETLTAVLPIISRSAWHASRIVQTLRGFSRRSSPILAPEILSTVVQDALLLMEYQVRSWGGVKLAKDLDPDGAVVLCDRNQIIQVIINLLTNARDAMAESGVITLRTRQTPATAVIEVVDQGAGISPEDLNRVFDPFFTTKNLGDQSGLGLGLSIVRDIVEAHHGKIEVESDGPGHGAAFRITLPLAS